MAAFRARSLLLLGRASGLVLVLVAAGVGVAKLPIAVDACSVGFGICASPSVTLALSGYCAFVDVPAGVLACLASSTCGRPPAIEVSGIPAFLGGGSVSKFWGW